MAFEGVGCKERDPQSSQFWLMMHGNNSSLTSLNLVGINVHKLLFILRGNLQNASMGRNKKVALLIADMMHLIPWLLLQTTLVVSVQTYFKDYLFTTMSTRSQMDRDCVSGFIKKWSFIYNGLKIKTGYMMIMIQT